MTSVRPFLRIKRLYNSIFAFRHQTDIVKVLLSYHLKTIMIIIKLKGNLNLLLTFVFVYIAGIFTMSCKIQCTFPTATDYIQPFSFHYYSTQGAPGKESKSLVPHWPSIVSLSMHIKRQNYKFFDRSNLLILANSCKINFF